MLQPSEELLVQNYEKFIAHGGRAEIFSASMGKKHVGQVTFATIGSVEKYAELFMHVGVVFIDECHLVPPKKVKEKDGVIEKGSMYMNFFNDMPEVYVIGFTATAFRAKKYRDHETGEPCTRINLLMRERPSFFNKMLSVTQISELYQQGFLSPIRYIPMAWDGGSLRFNTTGAEYSDESIDQAIKEQRIIEKIPSVVKQSIEKGRKYRIVFVKNVSDAKELSERVPDSAYVHALTKKMERRIIIEEFKMGKIKTIFNVGILTTGFDFPELDTIIIARPTMSLALYMQMVGRGIRIHPDKKDCALVDMCGNIERFGKIENIKYELDFTKKWILHNGEKILSGVNLSTI